MSILSETKFLIQKIPQKQLFINQLHSTMPFCLFKLPYLPQKLYNTKTCLPMNRYTDPEFLIKSNSYISVWSQAHLQSLRSPIQRNILNANKIILKNPFKTQEIIQKCLNLGINNMIIEDFQQMGKIHQCLQKNRQKRPINFIWNVSDCERDLQKLRIINSYNIKISHLLFNKSYCQKTHLIKDFIKKSNSILRQTIKKVFIETNNNTFIKTQKYLQQEDKFYTNNNINLIVQNNDIKMTNQYFIGIKILGQAKNKQIIFNQEAKYYITNQNIKKGEIVQKDGKKWLLMPIDHFPNIQKIQQHRQKGLVFNVV